MKTSDDQGTARLQDYLRSLTQDELDQVLNEVLVEIRNRASDQMKQDVLRHSQKLGLYKR